MNLSFPVRVTKTLFQERLIIPAWSQHCYEGMVMREWAGLMKLDPFVLPRQAAVLTVDAFIAEQGDE